MIREVLETNEPVKERQLAAFEVDYKLPLPDSYRAFLLRSNGGQPVPSAFPIRDFPSNPYGVVQAFFGLNAAIPTEDLNNVMADLTNLVPSGVIPIACTDGDDFLCIDRRASGEPVVFWDRKPFWGENIWDDDDLYFVAANFEAFLASLDDV